MVGTSISTKYRHGIAKNNPEKFREIKEKAKVRSKMFRDKQKFEFTKCDLSNKDLDKLKKQREKNALRQQKYREKKKEKSVVEANKRIKEEERLKLNRLRLQKQEQRSGQSVQKKDWIRKKDRERKLMKKSTTLSPVYKSSNAKSNAYTKVCHSLPKDAQKYVTTVSNPTVKCTHALNELKSNSKCSVIMP